ncbi:hypothetical protein H7J77_18755 [Mycolicibacillus parakoreensis]|uniref:Lipoprotein LprD n=1 Tax=Mycolicibacillus parakoreensis TaxID=1069221 RepID=A0ABY3UA21_9MYCO|nr:hypothetical protein [Mycolicibacillus parakoreensis]MCV7317571.1 hypothetical protein [Mycolicibacillus parakoreensis]ULN54280.1 hypothetical protein MIU77_08525 [Mycolicibacillus parakoreensis]
MSTTRRRRPALVLLVTAATCGCLALGWWQWTRFESAAGTVQNLGYALQWPLFAGFCVYAYRKFVRYEEVPPELPADRAPTEIPAGLLPERPAAGAPPGDAEDPQLRQYNAYLAELARADRRAAKTRDHDEQNRTTA